MPDTTWDAERIAALRRQLTDRNSGGVFKDAALSLLDALESAREGEARALSVLKRAVTETQRANEDCNAMQRRAETAEAEAEAKGARLYYQERYLRDPTGTVVCEQTGGFGAPCGGCEGCITAQTIYGITGKAVVS